ncbi:hypothetical protein GKZ28_05225 [Clostridium chromiireducens]|uniref:Autolysin n=1 Tax=Clostridium chromiireducens TaxID=225345 RepID=A0A964W1A5_9CLOT|nr:hypothetical protein [Clostridium chromiireducens]MVX63099.1 hypothetical protein [Clostridium chromiireducens]
MKKLRELLSCLLVIASITVLSPIGASASEWKQSNGQWWYTDDTGNYVTGWKYIDGNWYYMNEQGWMLHDTTIGGYTLGSNGAWVQSSNPFYFKNKGGAGGTAGTQTGAGDRIADMNGVGDTATTSTSAGKSANDKINGTVKAGSQTGAGQRISQMNGMGDTTTTSTSTSQKSTSGWEQVNGTWYYYDANGQKKTGWVEDSGNWYYLNNDGSMAIGWLQYGGNWYFLGSNGVMLKNTTVNGYTLGSNGAWVQSMNDKLKSHNGGTAGNDTAAGERISNINR